MLFATEGLLGFLLLALWVWALIDCISTDSSLCRNLPKGAWIIIVILLFGIGAVLWALLGRPMNKHWHPAAGDAPGSRPRPVGIEDRADFGAAVSDRRSAELDRRLADWEARRLESGSESGSEPGSGPPGSGEASASGDDGLAAREAALAEREAELRRREIELRDRELDARERDLDQG